MPEALPRPLKICHLAYSFYENDNRVVRYAQTLAGRGDQVDVITLRRPGQAARGRLNGVEIYRVQRRSRGERAAWVYLAKILSFWLRAFALLSVVSLRKRYDIVHVHNVPDFLVFAACVQKLLGARVILDIHDLLPEFYAGKFAASDDSMTFRALIAAERMSCAFADHVIVANHLWYDKLKSRSVLSSRCTPILNYPAKEFFERKPDAAAKTEGSFLLLYPGTLNHHQGVDDAVAAFARVCGRMPGARFLIHGEGPARESLREQAASLGLTDRVSICDPVPFHQMPTLMARADVGVVPKRADGFGNEAFSTKILEFMASGVPVIVSRTRVDSYYFDEQSVRFFTPGDIDDLARQMLWAFEHPRELRNLAATGNRLALEYSWQRHAGEYTGRIDALACAGRRARRSAQVTVVR
ncbi:MAG TPA: glycosyltransferase family 4 protein [Vicinamibacterales bacterium]|nr:glycosyltransferase family 4 protein [Vicinamibacterales bacterium]